VDDFSKRLSIVEAGVAEIRGHLQHLATKAEMQAVRVEMQSLRSDMHAMETRMVTAMSTIDGRLKAEIGELKAELKADIGEIKDRMGTHNLRMLMWMFATAISGAGVMTAIVKLIP
jgi:hypothetical protein